MTTENQTPYQQNYYASPESTNQYGGPVPPMPPLPPKPSKLKRFGLPVGLLLLGLIVGGVAGYGNKPEPVIQVQVQEKIVEKKVEVPVTPASCLKAIQYGEEVIQSSGRVVGVFSDILDAVKVLDAAKIKALNPKIDAENVILTELRPKYQSSRDSCRAAG